ncbi:8-oxo-dGTP diphosphatase MutT [Fluoribacter dumoffii]|uniref:8-oxo-dGTP diphosphatase n=1 Tax=Fluoribacter dumoffii TaxID=463 RepID=A0A377G9Y7_9GAMM|nr:8-oxo-dGTP diphosphatase MutT [Fluoribacter dumoffii]KTC93521.1 Mutator protein MutT [Fluoribacter dumoffii NY 23]MCW8385719.1 8-oxo-dGTP diphosphatase MutT [Fluoribacter dumoffii]MCW8418749.1 8-oxo-dGTP diphosphatase MutT [Fluoribacter dumoffii]MCW8453407.1 8-oxo-dGTP diphosphatase MutT [Fluoribacter dumoffii]MCW8459373.1 8-oxo-dGTP diphosphatase MutT [Fluoribacter dumoffii]
MNITVAVAVIIDEQQRILITQRPFHVPHGGCWEFPGGKLEANEHSASALIREIKEEVGLEVHQYHLLGEVNHQYSDKRVKLVIFLVNQFSGIPLCLEGQLAMKWVFHHELNPEHFPEANHQVIAMVKDYLCSNN